MTKNHLLLIALASIALSTFSPVYALRSSPQSDPCPPLNLVLQHAYFDDAYGVVKHYWHMVGDQHTFYYNNREWEDMLELYDPNDEIKTKATAIASGEYKVKNVFELSQQGRPDDEELGINCTYTQIGSKDKFIATWTTFFPNQH